MFQKPHASTPKAWTSPSTSALSVGPNFNLVLSSLPSCILPSTSLFPSHALHVFDDCSFLVAVVNDDHNVHGSLINSNMLEKPTLICYFFFLLIFDGFTGGPNYFVLKEMFGFEY